MSKTRWVIIAGTAVVALAVFLVFQGLERADMWASVLALFLAVGTLTVSLLDRRRAADNRAADNRGADSRGADSRGADKPVSGAKPVSPVTNYGTIGQVTVGDGARVRQTNRNRRRR